MTKGRGPKIQEEFVVNQRDWGTSDCVFSVEKLVERIQDLAKQQATKKQATGLQVMGWPKGK